MSSISDMKTLLHAAAAVLSIVLLFIQPRRALASVSHKNLNIGQYLFESDDDDVKPHSRSNNNLGGLKQPKFKKDPDIEFMGQEPLD